MSKVAANRHSGVSVRGQIETLAAKGLTSYQAARHLGCSPEYSAHVFRSLYGHAGTDDTRVSKDRDAAYVEACLAQGGFQTAVIVNGRRELIAHDGQPWTHRGRR